MPSTPMKNLIYRICLPFGAPNPHKQMKHNVYGRQLTHLPYYEHLLVKHRVLGASLLLADGHQEACVNTTVYRPHHPANSDTIFRVASITKMATALVTLMCVDKSLFSLDSSIRSLLPETSNSTKLDGMTIRHLLCHTSGLEDTPALEKALREGSTYDEVLATSCVVSNRPGSKMIYSNFGYGLLGCILENMAGQCINSLFHQWLFTPLKMRATLDASTLDESSIMPISRVLPYKKDNTVTITKLGRIPLSAPDPLRHFGHTAGAMYTDVHSLSNLLDLIANHGTFEGKCVISENLMHEMVKVQSSTPTRTYGLGLVLLNRPSITNHRLLGHQGFAYGCVDGAFVEEVTGRKVIFLNGGASEAREGKLGLVNKDILTWAYRKEFPSWT